MKPAHAFSSSGDTALPGDDLVSRLQSSGFFRDYQQAFQTATGLPLTLRPAGSFQAPLSGARNGNPFCALMAARCKTCSACLQMQERAEAEAETEAATVECFAGLSETLVPVRLGQKTIAYLQTGQVRLHAPTEKGFRMAIEQLTELNLPVDANALHDTFFKSRVFTKSQYEAIVHLLASFGQHLSLLTNEIVMQETAKEPPAVCKARAYIAQHLGEPLSLRRVAQAAYMSAFYFCKVFKASTGLTFTDYLARARVEKTKQLLLNPNTRISEAAFEAGFQSLSQFNRVFRRIVGESPSTFRDANHGSSLRAAIHPMLSAAA